MTAYIARIDEGIRVIINADNANNRRSRASQATALKRFFEKESGKKLRLNHVNYDELPDFLARSQFWYDIV